MPITTKISLRFLGDASLQKNSRLLDGLFDTSNWMILKTPEALLAIERALREIEASSLLHRSVRSPTGV